jgi:hypothetical protein
VSSVESTSPLPLPLCGRGYVTDYMFITLLLLKEKEMEDEVISKEKRMR